MHGWLLGLVSLLLVAAASGCDDQGDGDAAVDGDADTDADVDGDGDADADGDLDHDAGDDAGDGDLEHNAVLERLGLDTSPAAPTDPAGNPLPEGYHPLGRAHVALRAKMETFVAGFGHGGAHQYLIDDASAGWVDLYRTVDDSWTSSSHKNVIGADMDGDGIDEIAIVYFASGDSSLRLLVIDREDGRWVEHHATIATGISSRPSSGVYQPSLAAGDLDGDGRDELIVGFSTLYVVEDMVQGFAVTSRDYPGSDDLYVAAGELDGDGQDEMIVTFHQRGYAYCDIFDGNLSAPRLRSEELLHARGVDGGHTYRQHVQVRMADIDGDGLDEILFLGDRRDYDAWNVTARDDALHDLAWLEGFFYWAARDECAYRGFAVMDYDGDGRENEFFASFRLMRYEPEDGTVTQIHRLFHGAPGSGFCLHPTTDNVWAGDVDGDGRDELLYYDYPSGRLRVDGQTLTGTYANEWSTAGSHDRGSKLCTANVDDDSPVLAYRGEHELLFTAPTPIAVLAAPPYHADVGQNVEACATTFGRSSASGVEQATSTGISVGFSIGYEAEDPFGIASASFRLTVAQAFDWRSIRSLEIERSIAYTSGWNEDKVVFTAVPFDVYYYDIVSSPVPEEVGTVISINIPRSLQTLSVSREFYNANNGDFPDIDETVFGHTFGAVASYPTLADRNRLVADGGLYSLATPVGVGSGSITVTVSRTEGSGTGTAYDFSVTTEAEVGVGGVTFGTSAGFHYGWEHTVTNTESTFYEGTVGDIPAASYSPALAYSFGLFTYPFALGDQQFSVVSYWVE